MFRLVVLLLLILPSCSSPPARGPYILVLGIAQDAGYPQAACRKPCCEPAWKDPARRRLVSSIAVVDPISQERWIIDATPDFREQLHRLDASTRADDVDLPKPLSPSRSDLTGIFLTHAHVGHYTGIQHLGREVIGDAAVPVYTMPRLQSFLASSGPWKLLVSEEYISLRPLSADVPIRLNQRLTITPILVPHRDEYSETVAFRIQGPSRAVLFLPDIDKWEKWDRAIEDELARCEVAYIDGTFFANGEIPGRDMSQIPHPFIEESMSRFAPLPLEVRRRVRFIHLNHTNPALDPDGPAAQQVLRAGFSIAVEGERIPLSTDRP